MNPHSHADDSDEMRAEYDFSHGVRGTHHQAYHAGTNVVFLEADVAAAFPDSASVNQALRLLVRLSKTQAVSGRRRPKQARTVAPKKPRRGSRRVRG